MNANIKKMQPLSPEDMKAIWADRFPSCPPIPYLFKHCLGERWLRIYGLPDGKRFSDNATEEREILLRHNTVLTTMTGTASLVKIVHSIFDAAEPRNLEKHLQEFDFKLFGRFSKNEFDPEEDEEEIFLDCFFAETLFEPGKLDELLLAVADEKISDLFLYDIDSNRIFAPYDGGADLILENVETRDEYLLMFADWTSPRADGL